MGGGGGERWLFAAADLSSVECVAADRVITAIQTSRQYTSTSRALCLLHSPAQQLSQFTELGFQQTRFIYYCESIMRKVNGFLTEIPFSVKYS